ncbi:MAG: glucose 1-dehydrogenase [Pseudomonadota bacterium]
MTERLAGKTAMITGAGSGLGEATAKRFAQEGATVFVTDLDADAAERVVSEINATGASAHARQQDVTGEERWDDLMSELEVDHGGLQILVNNAGIVVPGSVEEASLAEWRQVQAVNSDAVFLGCRAAVRTMKKSGGSIINISSIEGLVGEPNIAAYNASKGAVRLLTKSAALYCAREGYGIRVNSIHPGFILTPMVERGFEQMHEDQAMEMMARVNEEIPLGSLGEPLDIANACLFLASDESKYMTGSELVIDGGYTCH